jgi:hypothetical protein
MKKDKSANSPEQKKKSTIQKFFEKQRVRVLGQNSQLLPLSKMIEDLVKLTDEQWGKYAFYRDLLAGKISMANQSEMIANAILCGREYGDKMRKECLDLSIKLCAEKIGINVSYPHRPEGGGGGGQVLFARYTSPNKIEVFLDCTEKADSVVESENLATMLDCTDVKDVLLAHELYHYYEERDADSIYTETTKVDTRPLRILHNYSKVACLGEIAAMCFAKELCGLSYSPYVYDVLLVWLYNKQIACNLYAKIMMVTA